MKAVSLIASALLVLPGCQSSADLAPTAADVPAITGPAAGTIAGDLTSRFAEELGHHGERSFRLEPDRSNLGVAMEAALKGWGYTVEHGEETAKAKTVPAVAYGIDSEGDRLLVHLRTTDLTIARAYTVTAAGASPASPFAVLRRN